MTTFYYSYIINKCEGKRDLAKKKKNNISFYSLKYLHDYCFFFYKFFFRINGDPFIV